MDKLLQNENSHCFSESLVPFFICFLFHHTNAITTIVVGVVIMITPPMVPVVLKLNDHQADSIITINTLYLQLWVQCYQILENLRLRHLMETL